MSESSCAGRGHRRRPRSLCRRSTRALRALIALLLLFAALLLLIDLIEYRPPPASPVPPPASRAAAGDIPEAIPASSLPTASSGWQQEGERRGAVVQAPTPPARE